jgi:hypothetical protein
MEPRMKRYRIVERVITQHVYEVLAYNKSEAAMISRQAQKSTNEVKVISCTQIESILESVDELLSDPIR